MPRRSARPQPDRTVDLPTHTRTCPACAGPLWCAATAQRTVVTLEGLLRLHLQIRSCRNPDCPRHRACLRPEAEGRYALPQHEFGLDVIATVGRLRHATNPLDHLRVIPRRRSNRMNTGKTQPKFQPFRSCLPLRCGR